MAPPPLKMDAEAVNASLRRAMPDAPPENLPRIIRAEDGRVWVVRTYDPAMLRPGGTVSGPALMGVADTAAFCLVLAHAPGIMAVTSNLSINFLRGAKPGDIHAECALLRLGRTSAVCDIRLWTEDPERLAAHATVTYALPAA